MILEEMEKKWTLGNDVYTHKNAINANKPILFIEDIGGTPPCQMQVIGISCFPTIADIAGHLRFYQIPRIISWNNDLGDTVEHDAATLVEMCDEDLAPQVEELIDALDACMSKDDIETSENDCFTFTV